MGWLKHLTQSASKSFANLDDKLNLSETGKGMLNPVTLLTGGGDLNITAALSAGQNAIANASKPPPIPTLPPVPTIDNARALLDAQDRARQRRGRAASILSDRPTDPLGYTGGAHLSVSQLLGG